MRGRNAEQGAAGPLSGLRVVEVCHMLAGPYCGMLLADLGAEVIKVETGDGDISRKVGPDYVGQHNVYFASLNRNKKSVLIDLKSSQGWREFEKLIETSDALIANLRPRAILGLGLTYDNLKQLNPKLVCLALTGFGLTGRNTELPAYDYIIQALAGLMMLTGEPGGPPVRVGYSVVDNTGGMMGVIGVLSKLIEGRGGQIDIALYDLLLSQLNYFAAAYLTSGSEPKRQPGGGHAHMVPAQLFETKDGYISLFISHDQFWKDFSKAVGKTEWGSDPRFETMEARRMNRDLVIQEVQDILAHETGEHWISLFQPIGLVVASVNTLKTALAEAEKDSRDMVVSIPTSEGVLRLVGNPIKIAGWQEKYEAPPLLGEHTDELIK